MSPTREIQKEFPSQEFPRAQFDTAQTTNKPNQKQKKQSLQKTLKISTPEPPANAAPRMGELFQLPELGF